MRYSAVRTFAVIAGTAILLSGCAVANGATSDPVSPKPSPTLLTHKLNPASYVGGNLATAGQALRMDFWTVTTNDVEQGQPIIDESNWTVTAAKVNGDSVTLEAKQTTPTASPTPTPSPTIDGQPQQAWAETACETAGTQKFPAGFDPHWILDLMANTYDPATQTRFLKAKATVTNIYGTKLTQTIECSVTGTNDAPTVTSLLVY